jgi:hypothetical protein
MAGDDESKPITPNTWAGQRLRLDYAWKWFDFHAEQRTKMFNYMLLGLGIFSTGLVTAIEKRLLPEALALSVAAVVITAAFWRMDHRNRWLYRLAQDVLVECEDTFLFGSVSPGIASRMDKEDGKLPKGFERWLEELKVGRHRVFMPLVIFVFGLLFLGAGIRVGYMMLHRDESPTDKTIVCCDAARCCQQGRSEKPTGSTSGQTSQPIPGQRVMAVSGNDNAKCRR